MKPTAIITLILMGVFLLGSGTYMAADVLDLAATKKVNKITVLLPTSGGLMRTSQATMRGIKVGQVSAIQATAAGLSVSVNLDTKFGIPKSSRVSIQNLSAAGEQYMEFTPTALGGPYLDNGDIIQENQVAPSYTVSEILQKGNALINALDASNIKTILTNFGAGIVDNEAVMDKLALTTRMINQMVQDDKQNIDAFINNSSDMTRRLGEIEAGRKIHELAKMLPSTMEEFIYVMDGVKRIAEYGFDEVHDGAAIRNLIDKLVEYFGRLAEPARKLTNVLDPLTTPVRELKIDAGHFLDFWESTFSNTGGMRVHLGVPEYANEAPTPSPQTINPNRAAPQQPSSAAPKAPGR